MTGPTGPTLPRGTIQERNAFALALETVRGFEGFVPDARMDVNHVRVGYGSDTWTDAEGNIHEVTADTVITRADAERDLARRVAEFQAGIIRDVGQRAWTGLTAPAKAAVTSLAYNYGGLSGLPSLRTAIRSGDMGQVAQAILNRSVDNEGGNARRRQAEAQLVLSHPVPLALIPNIAPQPATASARLEQIRTQAITAKRTESPIDSLARMMSQSARLDTASSKAQP